MLALLAYVVLLLVIMPALLLCVGKLAAVITRKRPKALGVITPPARPARPAKSG